MNDKSKIIKHAPSVNCEFTLCSLAFDAFESGDETSPVIFAKPGETVTCENCRIVIDHINKYFDGYLYLQKSKHKLVNLEIKHVDIIHNECERCIRAIEDEPDHSEIPSDELWMGHQRLHWLKTIKKNMIERIRGWKTP